jgi:branched-chain amino acid transport system permease protein
MSPSGQASKAPNWALRVGVSALVVALIYGAGFAANYFLLEYIQRIILLVGIYMILAVGLNLINGTTGQFSIGHAGFMAVGAYAAAFTGNSLRPLLSGALGAGTLADAITFNVALLVGALFAGIAGLVVGMPSLRLKGDYLAIVTLGFGEIIRIVFTNATFMGAATGYFGDDPAGLPSYTNFFWVCLWVVIVVVGIRNLTFSQTGRSLIAIREDEIAAEAMGTPTTQLKVTAFTIAAASAGIAGGLFAHMQSGIRPDDFKFEKSIDMIVMIILGGLGSITGSILGAVFLVVSLELMRDLQEYRLVLYALLLVVIMLVRPQGLLGRRELSLKMFRRGKNT